MTPPSSVTWDGYHLTSALRHFPPPLQVCWGTKPQCDQMVNKDFRAILQRLVYQNDITGMIGGLGVWTCT